MNNRKTQKKYSLLFLLCSLQAQATSSINGFVRDDSNGEPLGYANVFIKGTKMGTASSMDGYFVISNIPIGKYDIAVSIIGYEMITKNIEITSGENKRLEFRLQRTVIEGQIIDVFGESQKMRQMVEPSRITLDLRTLETVPAFIEPDLFRTVQMLPGVQTLNDFSSALYVRGSTPDQNLIMLDGITVYNPYHLGGIFSTFNTDAIKEADFHAGGFPSRYGGRMGAILNVINREGNTEKFQGNANISIISSKGLLEGPLPKFKGLKGSWMLAGRRTYFDQFFRLFIPKETFEFPYYFYDYQVKVNLDLNNDHRLTYSRFYGDDILNFSYSDTYERYDIIDDYGEKNESSFSIDWPWGNRTNSLTWRWLVSPQFVVKTFLANSRYRFHFDLGFADKGTWTSGSETGSFKDEFSFDFFDVLNDNTFETELSWHGLENHHIMTGVQLKQVKYDLGMEFEYSTLDTTLYLKPLEMMDTTRETSIFIQDKWNITPRLAIQIGTRISDYALHDNIYIDPRFGLKYIFRKDLSIKFSLGRFHQFLTIVNLEDESWQIVDFWLGLPEDRPATWADHTILGLEYLSGNNWLFRAETYYKHFENLITLKQGELFQEDGDQLQFTPFNEFYDTRAYAYGIEFLLKKTAGKIRGWIGYTFAETNRHIKKHGWYQSKYDRTHTLNIVGDLELRKDVHFSTSLQTSSGQPFTPPVGRYEQWYADHKAYGTNWFYNQGFLVDDKNSARLSPYFRLDVGLKQDKTFFGRPYQRFLQLVNVTNHINPLTHQYRNKTNRLTGETLGLQRAEVPMFPFFLTMGLRVEF
ncbi:MAG: hypothetical protein CMG74_11485 [Candidatus Marinimicrobia bacterium]|nr:hypothetical protein [Candidatus Neomarinimicrobiota bacterium]